MWRSRLQTYTAAQTVQQSNLQKQWMPSSGVTAVITAKPFECLKSLLSNIQVHEMAYPLLAVDIKLSGVHEGAGSLSQLLKLLLCQLPLLSALFNLGLNLLVALACNRAAAWTATPALPACILSQLQVHALTCSTCMHFSDSDP